MFDRDQLSAASVASVLPALDLASEWSNTGGGVFNLEVPLYDDGDVFAYVGVSDNGDWGYGDYEASAESVSVTLYDAFTGDSFDVDAWCPVWPNVDRGDGCECAYASTIDEAQTLIRMAVAHARACMVFGEGE